jgi:integrase
MSASATLDRSAAPATSLRISSRSSFGDPVWHIDIPVAQVRKNAPTINWHIPLSDGSLLTETRHSSCLMSCKTLLVLLLEGKGYSGIPHRGGSLVRKYEAIRTLLSWLPATPKVSLSDLNEARLASYRKSLQVRRAKVRGKGGNFVSAERRLSKASVRQMLQIVVDLAYLRDVLPDAPDLSLFEAQRLAYSTASSNLGSTPRIPDPHFEALMQASIRWLIEVAPLVLQRDADLRSIKQERGSANISRYYQSYYEGARERQLVRVGGSDHDIASLKRLQLISWLNFTQTACFVIIAGFTGMRASEILSIRGGCLSTKPIADQQYPLLQINGTLFKTSANAEGEPAACIAGWDDGENPVRVAVDVLEAIQGRYPDDAARTLFSAIREKRLSTTEGRSGQSVAMQVNRFAALIGVCGWRFSAHQFRKTFARFVSIKAPMAVLALQRHFKHVSVAMTERYISYDDALLDEIIEQSFDLDLETLDRVLAADTLGGLKGEVIVLRNQAFRGDAGEQRRRDYIESIRNDPLFLMLRHEYGLCFYEADQAACGGRRIKIGLETCVDCRNFVAGPEHASYWRDRLRALAGDHEAVQALGQASEVLDQQLQTANKVLHAIAKA